MRSLLDPKSYYATLGVGADAPSASIHAAYRKKAKVLHPDMPRTGNAGAFLRVKEAYEVLSDPLRRAEYDRTARASALPSTWRPTSFDPDDANLEWAPPVPAELADIFEPAGMQPESSPSSQLMPTFAVERRWLLWLGGGISLCIIAGIIGIVWQIGQPKPTPIAITNTMTVDLPTSGPVDDPGPPPADQPGSPYYILPVAAWAVFWQFDKADHHFRPVDHLPPFTTLNVLRTIEADGLSEVRLLDGKIGYIYPHLLAAGDATDARRAECIYRAGPEPRNAELLLPPSVGANAPMTQTITILNSTDTPAVFSMTNKDQHQAVYISPHAQAVLNTGGSAADAWRIEYATGDIWSRSCFRFMAGMTAHRLPDLPLRGSYTIPTAPSDLIAEEEFGR